MPKSSIGMWLAQRSSHKWIVASRVGNSFTFAYLSSTTEMQVLWTSLGCVFILKKGLW